MLATLLGLLLIPGWTLAAAPPDILLPGHKSVKHVLILDWDQAVAGQRFVAHPIAGFHGHHEIERGQPFAFSSKYGTRIYAVPTSVPFPEQRDDVAALQWPSAPVPVAQVSSIAAGNPLARVETTLRVEQVTDEGIGFTVVGERRLDASGNEISGFGWLVLVLIAGAGIVLLLVLSRRSRPTAAAATA